MGNTNQQVAKPENKIDTQKAKNFGIAAIVMRPVELGFSLLFLKNVNFLSGPSVPRLSGMDKLSVLTSFFVPGISIILAWIFTIIARSNDKKCATAKAALIVNITVAALKLIAVIIFVAWFNHQMADCYINQVGHE